MRGFARADALLTWYADARRPLPWRFTRDPWALLVAEVMLQQTQAARVVPYWERFLARFPDPEAVAAAPARDVLAAWSGLGYNRRALAGLRHARLGAGLAGRTLPRARLVAGRPARLLRRDRPLGARACVVAALVAGEALPAGVVGDRRERVLAGLERDGLIVRAPDGSARLP